MCKLKKIAISKSYLKFNKLPDNFKTVISKMRVRQFSVLNIEYFP